MNAKNACIALSVLIVQFIHSPSTLAQGTSFTYQGRLTTNGVPQGGSYDLAFTLYDAASGGNALAGPVTNSTVTDVNGLFNVTLDFGGSVFDGQPRWLQIGVRPVNSGNFIPLSPRQALTASPYAFFADSPQGPAGTPGSVWREGSGAPVNALGIDGDYYLNGTTGDVYQRTSGTYTLLTNIKGPSGPVGVAIPFHGIGFTNVPLFEVDNSSSGNGLSGITGTGYGVFGQANAPGGWGGLFRYGSDGNNSAYLGANGSAGVFYGPVSVNGGTSGALFEANNAGSGGLGVAVRGDSPCGTYGELGVGASPTACYGVYGNAGNGGYAGWFDGRVNINGALSASSSIGAGVQGSTDSGYGVYGYSANGTGLYGYSDSGQGVHGYSASGYAGYFGGKVTALGTTTGDWNAALVRFENQNSGASSSPALRVVANGDAPNGALSVSTQGTGLIAQFGNANSFVARLDANGNWYAVTLNPTSDRNLKENLHDISPAEVLEKVAQLHISRWNFKSEAATQHIGPMAQDFYSAFGLGSDDKHIATVDADGVALAAIQALNEKIAQKDTEIQTLKQRLDEMELLLHRLAAAPAANDHMNP